MKRSAFYREVFGAKGVPGELEYHGKAEGIISVPDSLIFAGDFLTSGEVRLCLAFLWHCQRRNPGTRVSWPSREMLGVMIGVTPRQVTTYIKGLTSKGVLHVRQRANGTSYYLLCDVPENKMNRTKERLPKPERVEVFQKRLLPKAPLQPTSAKTLETSVCSSPSSLDAQKELIE